MNIAISTITMGMKDQFRLNDPGRNYGIAASALFPSGITEGCIVERVNSELQMRLFKRNVFLAFFQNQLIY